MAIPRSSPYIHVTWLTKLLSGDDHCEWAAWFKAHHQSYDRVPSTFDSSAWQIAHGALVNETRDKLEAAGHTVFTEKQNYFTLRGASGATIGGQPDLVGTLGESGVIYDAKTGQPRASDHIQVQIYMWALPLAFRQYRGMTFDGKVVYQDHEVDIPASSINEAFKKNLFELVNKVSGQRPLRKAPSILECGFCPIAQSECPERQSREDEQEELIADF